MNVKGNFVEKKEDIAEGRDMTAAKAEEKKNCVHSILIFI